jgi:hypothetical protein
MNENVIIYFFTSTTSFLIIYLNGLRQGCRGENYTYPNDSHLINVLIQKQK